MLNIIHTFFPIVKCIKVMHTKEKKLVISQSATSSFCYFDIFPLDRLISEGTLL